MLKQKDFTSVETFKNSESKTLTPNLNGDYRIKIALLGVQRYVKSYESSILHLEKDYLFLPFELLENRTNVIDLFENVINNHKYLDLESLQNMASSTDDNEVTWVDFFVNYGVSTFEGRKIYFQNQSRKPTVALMKTLASYVTGESLNPELFSNNLI